MAITSRQARGRATQQMAARWFREHGWPHAEAVWGSQSGRDIKGMPAMAPEVKATADDPNPAALRQAKRNAHPDDVVFVLWRPNGFGEANIEDWPVSMTLGEFVRLAADAGYGNSSAGSRRALAARAGSPPTPASDLPPGGPA